MKIYSQTIDLSTVIPQTFFVSPNSQFKMGVKLVQDNEFVVKSGDVELTPDETTLDGFTTYTLVSSKPGRKTYVVECDNGQKIEITQVTTKSTVFEVGGEGGSAPIGDVVTKVNGESPVEGNVDVDKLKIEGGFVTGDVLINRIAEVEDGLDGKANADDIPTKTSDLENDSGYVTTDDIPTKVSELENDAEYLNQNGLEPALDMLERPIAHMSDIPTSTSQLENDSGFITGDDLVVIYLTEGSTTELTYNGEVIPTYESLIEIIDDKTNVNLNMVRGSGKGYNFQLFGYDQNSNTKFSKIIYEGKNNPAVCEIQTIYIVKTTDLATYPNGYQVIDFGKIKLAIDADVVKKVVDKNGNKTAIQLGNTASGKTNGKNSISASCDTYGASTAVGEGSIVVGSNCEAGSMSAAFGYTAKATHMGAFVFQGKAGGNATSKGDGTFVANTQGGTDGFYIGTNNLTTILDNKVSSIPTITLSGSYEDGSEFSYDVKVNG